MTIRAIVVDDEPNARQNLGILVENHCPNVEIVGMASSVQEAVQAIKTLHPDMVFLDIEIGEGSGFDILEKIGPNPPEIIFTTAFDQYAVRAFRYSATDYLLKPIDIEELEAAVMRVSDKIRRNQISRNLENLMSNLGQRERKMRRIGLPVQGGIQYFYLEEIIRLQSHSNYTAFHLTKDREFLVSRTLKEYDEMLSNQGFVRVHQSHLINLEHVSQYQKADGGYVIMSDGSSVPLSKTHKDNFLENLNRI